MELKQNKMKLLAVTFVLTISWLSVNGQGEQAREMKNLF